ncbi:structural maintenance of chromosomes protein 1B isoform X2 [Polyodon spathula]|uniref:structural maintenance of chromosomes protein 1B isoform X2 n=1 Tax=Polyodon spathula TaxID=7913 RepID=UPI001B7E97F7|nr:structural maintenance of chromosomes protein 1B isoform X2 [Polyodon spathula]
MGYLKQIDVENFKSWRGRQIIGPFKRFNCIIGTNGSGKSNVMDALSFVMGERAVNLRVKHTRDLIHGAHIGKPASATARVMMTYCEENGEENTFSRTITGDSSEYHLNGRVVSLSHYTSELQKIGIIVKARNCLVFQGAVESIAMKKPKERTQLFERISNSLDLADSYEKKKKELQKAEEDAQFHYNKKKNVAAEQKHVKQEKEEAQKYQTLVEDLNDKKVQLHLCHLYYNEKSIDSLKDSLQEKKGDIAIKKSSLEQSESKVRALKKEHGRLSREQQQIEKEIKAQEQALNQKRPQYIKAKVNTSHQIKKVEEAKSSLKKSEKQFSKKEQEIQELENELADLEKAWRDFERKVEEQTLTVGRDVQLEESQVKRYKELKELARKKVATMSQHFEKLRWELNADFEKLEFDQRRKKEVEGNMKHTLMQIDDYTKRAEQLEEYINTCNGALIELRKQEESLVEEMETSMVRTAELNEKLGGVLGELQNARIDHHEGRRQQMRDELLESMKRHYPEAVFGRLFDLCHPIHKKYQLAITKVFGRYMNAIVVTTEKTARDCIRFLKDERAEPETFLALDYLEIKPINERLRDMRGAKMVIDVVQCISPQLKKVVQFVCGNGLVCETLKEARQIAFGGTERFKTVALDGTLFSKSGVISGGSSDLRYKARRWDEKEMDKLKEKRDELVSELRELMKVKRKEADLKQVQAQAQGVQTRLKYSQSELETIKKKNLANCLQEKSRLESELMNLESQLLMLKRNTDEKEAKTKEIQQEINKIEDLVFFDFCIEIGVGNIREYEEEYVKQQQEVDEKRLRFETQKSRLSTQVEYERSQLDKERKKIQKWDETINKEEKKIAEQKKEEESLLKAVDRAMAEQQVLKNRLLTKKSEADDAKKELEKNTKELLVISRELGKLQKQSISLETALEQKKMERHNLLLACKILGLQITLLSGSLDEISEGETNSSSSSLDTESTDTTAGIYEREGQFQIDYSDLSQELKDLRSEDEVEAQLNRLQQTITTQESVLQRATAPNMKALEKIWQVKDKFHGAVDAFDASRRRARQCRQEFEQIKAKRYQLFSACFEHISVAIDQIYKQLCRNTSAQAFLSPENPEEPYLEGISYNCVAPGKRFMPMDNLSGGEKSIAALALLFAIHSYRPAPFFVLDEVDAALDNTNIGKVTSYIREQSREHFQVIVISLKEEFYSKADALMGVYSEQDDCMFSRVLTLDLSPYTL